jgi:hypothetical protein
MAIGGDIQLLRTVDAATMIRIEPAIPVNASRASTRARSGLNVTRACRSDTELVPGPLAMWRLIAPL